MLAASRLGVALALLAPCTSALAHGDPPAAFAILSHDAEGPRAVHLSYGVALRRAPDRYQFVCPSAWGDQYGASVAALADGTIVVGAASGLKLLAQDGSVRSHPDPIALGNTTELVHAARGVFSVRNTAAGSEVLAVDAHSARVLWQDTKAGYSLAALDDRLVLVRGADITLEQVIIAMADGKELERQLAVVNTPIDYAFARAAAGSAYALVMFRTVAALGSLNMNGFTKIAEGLLSVAGPLSLGESTLLAPDGKLSQLASGALSPLAEQANVLCLSETDGLSYACNPEGIARVSDQALGAPLFQLSWLVPPDLQALSDPAARELCNAQWQDLRVDLMLAGVNLLVETSPDAGTEPADAGPPPVDRGAPADAGVPDGAAHEPNAGELDAAQGGGEAPRMPAGSSCAARPGPGCNFAAYLYAALVVVMRRAVFRRARPRVLTGSDAATDS